MDADQLTHEVTGRYTRLLEEGADPNEWAYAWRSEFNRGGFKAVDFLREQVIAPDKCVGCAACVTICPVDVFDYADEKPLGAQLAGNEPDELSEAAKIIEDLGFDTLDFNNGCIRHHIYLEVSRQKLFCFQKKGFEKTTILDICERLDIKKTQFHKHFKSVDEVIEILWAM